MLEIEDLDAFYGDAQALWGVDLRGRTRRDRLRRRAQRRRQVHARQCIAGLHRGAPAADRVDGADLHALPAHRGLRVRGRDRARGPPGVPADDRLGQPLPRRLPARRPGPPIATTLDRVHELFPRLAERGAAARRQPQRRRAADAGDRPGADGQAAAAAARRAVARAGAGRRRRGVRRDRGDQRPGRQRAPGRAGRRPRAGDRRPRLPARRGPGGLLRPAGDCATATRSAAACSACEAADPAVSA